MTKILDSGAEAVIERVDANTIRKTRPQKMYRLASLDIKLRRQRTRSEARILATAMRHNVTVPALIKIDEDKDELDMEYIHGKKLRDILCEENGRSMAKKVGLILATMHNAHIIHNDLTTSNMMYRKAEIVMIDFGLSFISQRTEDKACDLHLLRCAIESYHPLLFETFFPVVIAEYETHCKNKEVLDRLAVVEKRGKNKH